MIAVAKALQMEVLAEGVETEEQKALLLELGCERMQGYLFGRPVDAAEFASIWADGSANGSEPASGPAPAPAEPPSSPQ